MPDTLLARRATFALVTLLLAGVFVFSFERARRGQWDFEHFYHDARHVYEHGALPAVLDPTGGDAGRRLPFYLPSVAAMLAPLAALGRVPAALVWAAAQVACLGYSLRTLGRWLARANGNSGGLTTLLLLGLPVIYEAARFNQLSFPVLALLLAGLNALEGGRRARAGAWLGLAIALKLLPAIALPWLALKRQWTALSAALVTLLALATLPAVVAYGPRQAAVHYREWWDFNVGGDAARGLITAERREHFLDYRNQSIAQVLARLTWAEHPYHLAWQPLRLAPGQVALVANLLTAGVLVALLLLVRRPWQDLDPDPRRGEIALVGLTMLVASPLLRQYYLVWALPAVAVMLAWRASRAAGLRRLGWIGLIAWGLGMLAWLSPPARSAGANLVMLLLMAGVLGWGLVTSRGAGATAVGGSPPGPLRPPRAG